MPFKYFPENESSVKLNYGNQALDQCNNYRKWLQLWPIDEYLIKVFTSRFSDYQEPEALKTSLCEHAYHAKEKGIQGFVKVLILLHKIYTSVIVERIWCVASENTLKAGNADTDIKKLPFIIVLFINSRHVLMCT